MECPNCPKGVQTRLIPMPSTLVERQKNQKTGLDFRTLPLDRRIPGSHLFSFLDRFRRTVDTRSGVLNGVTAGLSGTRADE